jgi:hypothetical protein
MRRRIMQFGSDEHDVGYIARTQVRQWLMARTDLFRFEVAPLLVGRHALATRVNVEAFDVAIRKGIGGEQTLPTILELIAEIADTLGHSSICRQPPPLRIGDHDGRRS